MDCLREISFNKVSQAKVIQLLTDIIEFPVIDVKIHQYDGFREPVPDSRLKPLSFSHDVVSECWKVEEVRLG